MHAIASRRTRRRVLLYVLYKCLGLRHTVTVVVCRPVEEHTQVHTPCAEGTLTPHTGYLLIGQLSTLRL